jgi:signal transduction histidine kinase
MTEPKDEMSADREWLVNQIAHALRNPIFAATVQTEALHLRISDPAAVAKTADSLHGQLLRLSGNIDEMLLFGRPIHAAFEEVSVADILGTLVTRYANGDRVEASEISCNEVDEKLTGWWDRNAVIVILERILDNAVQHTESPHEVQILAAPSGDGALVFTISDDGAGMPPEILENALLPFYPQHSGRPGLGLAIADKFAKFFGGRIDIASTPNQGTTVKCTLPLRTEKHP